ncbi:carboxymuconolactone decarboxylase family protein [Granulicella sibirica]|uniref:Carboxymuconolactone decarboxylase n=1 Tax=Granulicella sibirica TaxID=2479048 RepID=A0A4Q0T160_9BACT|nr:carboxymuconolactone decarboxylase family protein [Granulicella sibirica]RXH57355.1 Carboxymuconolactone decarboxylase [Granulicella sibirica]
MAHIGLNAEIPGIGAAFAFRPETAKPMRELAHILLFEPGPDASLSSRDRELIASYVSSRNTCFFCQTSHGAAASSHVGGSPELTASVCASPATADISDKLKALLIIAAHVQGDAKSVTSEHIEAAREQGATDLEIHDTVLIAAAFCMYNRYVDGLATWQPRNEEMYRAMGKRLAEHGYKQSSGVRS